MEKNIDCIYRDVYGTYLSFTSCGPTVSVKRVSYQLTHRRKTDRKNERIIRRRNRTKTIILQEYIEVTKGVIRRGTLKGR